MSRVDDELTKALEESERMARAEPVYNVSVAKPPPSSAKRNVGLLAALLVMGGGILTLVFTSFEDAAVYSRTVDKLLQEKQKLTGRSVRVEGELVQGTLKRREEPCEYRFSIQNKGVALPVHYAQCIVPDTFQDVAGINVTVEGQLSQAGHFEATTIMAKCPSKYEERAKRGEQSPHLMAAPPS
jgi:cytochrome c-type biogenesis protein CcmE